MKKILLMFLFLLSACNNENRKTPLEWCLWEIHKHEDYDCDWSYIYNEIKNYEDINNSNLYGYYVTVFTDEKIGEWYCFVECKIKTMSKSYKPEEILLIDCDLARESYYEIPNDN